MKDTQQRLEYLRGELRAGTMSYGDLVELQSLARHIDRDDVELLEAAGVPEGQAESSPTNNESLRERLTAKATELVPEKVGYGKADTATYIVDELLPLIEAEYQKRENALLDDLLAKGQEWKMPEGTLVVFLKKDIEAITAHPQDSKKGEEDE